MPALMLMVLATAIVPLFAELGPWHGHVVVGGASAEERALALWNHRHSIDNPQGITAGEHGALVLSVAESSVFSAVSLVSGPMALVPYLAFPFMAALLFVLQIRSRTPGMAQVGFAPPKPPPR